MKVELFLKNLNCANCASKIEKNVSKIKEVVTCNLNFATSKLIIELDVDKNKKVKVLKEILKIVKAIEPKVKVFETKDFNEDNKVEKIILAKNVICLSISIMLLISTFFIEENNFKNIVFYMSYLVCSFDIICLSFKNIIKGEIFDENFLMLIATIGALLIGENVEAVLVIILYKIGESLNDTVIDKSRRSISDVINLKTTYAIKLEDEKEIILRPEELNVGDVVLVKPGEKIPTSGIVLEGNSNVDKSSLTGESMPETITQGNVVYGGTLNIDSLIKMRVTKKYEDSEVAKILSVIEDSNNTKAGTEKFITKFSRYYTPFVIIFAFLIIVFSYLKDNTIKEEIIYKSLSFLVVSCPCALVISVPLTYFASIGLLSKKGILVKGANIIDKMLSIKNVVFDKTGTLTKGEFIVTDIIIENIDEDNIKHKNNNNKDLLKEDYLKYIKLAQKNSNHPIAKALSKYLKDIDTKDNKIKEMNNLPGRGILAVIDDNKILMGNKKLMEENNIDIVSENKVNDDVKNKELICYIAVNNKYVGYIKLADQIKSEANEVIDYLKCHQDKSTKNSKTKNKIMNILMLTGDTGNNAKIVADKLKIDYLSDLMPLDKVNVVDSLKEDGKVMFIGDGVNDSPVLVKSDVGISMGNIGSDAAIEASDVVIMNDNLSSIIKLFKVCKLNRRIILQNIIFSISFKVIVLCLLLLGYVNMLFAVFADVGTTVLVILNSMRIFKIKL